MFEKVHRAGLIVYREDPQHGLQLLFMRPSDETYGGPHFQISKGRIEAGETAKQAAIREGQEELGLFKTSIIGEVHEIGVFLGRTTFFVCQVKPDALFGLPDEETGDTRWLTPEQFFLEGRPLHFPVVRAALHFIGQLANNVDSNVDVA